MHLDIVLIDMLYPNSNLDTYKISPNEIKDKVIIDRIIDIDPSIKNSSKDLRSIRLYNKEKCKVDYFKSKSLNNVVTLSSVEFQFEHMGIPVGSSRLAHGGIYHLLLPNGYKLTELMIVDPYDKFNEDIRKKKEFSYRIYWDNNIQQQLVEMDLRSGRGSFSFIVIGKAHYLKENFDLEHLPSNETEHRLTYILDNNLISDDAREVVSKSLTENLLEGTKYLELKPNFFGMGVNFNEIAQRFKSKLNGK